MNQKAVHRINRAKHWLKYNAVPLTALALVIAALAIFGFGDDQQRRLSIENATTAYQQLCQAAEHTTNEYQSRDTAANLRGEIIFQLRQGKLTWQETGLSLEEINKKVSTFEADWDKTYGPLAK